MLTVFHIILSRTIWLIMLVSVSWIRIHMISFHFNFNQHFFLGAEDMVINKTDVVTDFKEHTI